MRKNPVHTIRVSTETGTRRFEPPWLETRTSNRTVDPPGAEDLFRGPVRLRIEMPLPRHEIAARWLQVTSSVLALIVMVVLLTRHASGAFAYALMFFLMPLAVGLGMHALLSRPSAMREILEVDSRFVTLSYDDTVMAAWGRHQFTNLRVADPSAHEMPRLLGPQPTIYWGSNTVDTMSLWAAGSGITTDTARLLIEHIKEFCEEHPPDPSLDYRGTGIGLL